MLTTEFACLVRITVEERAKANVHAHDVVVCQRIGQDLIQSCQQIRNVFSGGRRVCAVQMPIGVSRPNNPMAS